MSSKRWCASSTQARPPTWTRWLMTCWLQLTRYRERVCMCVCMCTFHAPVTMYICTQARVHNNFLKNTPEIRQMLLSPQPHTHTHTCTVTKHTCWRYSRKPTSVQWILFRIVYSCGDAVCSKLPISSSNPHFTPPPLSFFQVCSRCFPALEELITFDSIKSVLVENNDND